MKSQVGLRKHDQLITNLDSILKSRDITLPTKVHLVKAMGFPVVIYRRESWAIKKDKHRRIYAFFILFYFLTLQYCIGFAIYQHELMILSYGVEEDSSGSLGLQGNKTSPF